MPTRAAAAPAAAAPTPAAAVAKKARTNAAMGAEARALCKRRTDAHAAAMWAHENKVGSRKTQRAMHAVTPSKPAAPGPDEPRCNFADYRITENGGSRTEGLRSSPCFHCKKAYFHHVCCAAAGCEEDARALCAACLGVPVFSPSPRADRVAKRKRAAELAKTPDGMASGSLQAERAKVKALRAALEEREAEDDAPFDPVAAGLLMPDAVTRPDKPQGKAAGKRRLSDLHGSVTMRDVAGEARRRREEAEAAEEKKQEKKRRQEEKKEVEKREADEREAAFARCERGCVCGVMPCPWLGWKRCPTCGPKRGLCRVRACAAARAPPLLGYNPPAEAPEGAEGAA